MVGVVPPTGICNEDMFDFSSLEEGNSICDQDFCNFAG